MPSGFWKNFNKSYLNKNISNQGPWGGTRAMYWQAIEKGTFIKKDILAFAEENGWTIVDSIVVDSVDMSQWMSFNKPVFPLSWRGFKVNTADFDDGLSEKFPRWIYRKSIVYQFKTGWIVYEPGTNVDIDVNGFVLLSDDEMAMSVYHLWGD